MPAAATDLHTGSFSDEPPWTIDDPGALAWRAGLDDVRAAVVAEVPALTTPGRWPPGARLVTSRVNGREDIYDSLRTYFAQGR